MKRMMLMGWSLLLSVRPVQQVSPSPRPHRPHVLTPLTSSRPRAATKPPEQADDGNPDRSKKKQVHPDFREPTAEARGSFRRPRPSRVEPARLRLRLLRRDLLEIGRASCRER